METTEILLNKKLIDQAEAYARKAGLNLSDIIEDFLTHLIQKSPAKQETPDIVLSLLGAGSPVGEDDLNGREAYHKSRQ